MSWLRKVKTLNTACSVQATGKLFKLPWAGKETSETQVYDKSRRLAEIDWDRIVLFNGKWHLPPVTVKPRFEVWNYVKLQSDSEPEPKLLIDPKISAIFRTKNLLLVGAGVIGVVGILCYLHRQQRKRFEANVANAVAASVHSALVEALKNVTVKEAIGQAARDAVTPVRTSNLTTEEVLKARLDAEGLKEMNLGTLLEILDLKVSLPKLVVEVLKVEDLLSSSVEKLVGYGIPQDHAVKIRNAVMHLLDLHKPSFVLA